MSLHNVKRGLRLPLSGEPSVTLESARVPRFVALMATDYVGLRPTMHVSVGDAVGRGQLLFDD